MATRKSLNLRLVDTCLSNREDVAHLRALLEKIEKCCAAVQRNANLADIVSDPGNFESLSKTLTAEEQEMAFQMLVKFALAGFETKSFALNKKIDGRKKIDFIYMSVGGWKQFDTVLLLQFPDAVDGRSFLFVNPLKQPHWKAIREIPEGTLVTVFLKTANSKRSTAEEKLATERFEAVFETVQHRSDSAKTISEPVIQVQKNTPPKPAAKPRVGSKPKPVPSFKSYGVAAATNTTPVMSFKVVINKMDTFVHAGNAHLILNHIQTYGGKVSLYVLRAEKKQVRLDADSIWSAEIRNGETVLFEFFGAQPTEAFLKELAKKVNKYTQMDKLVNE